MKTTWMTGTPDQCNEFKDKLGSLLFVVHTAPVQYGVANLLDEDYSITTWNKDNKVWNNIYEGELVLEWTPFERGKIHN